MIDETSLAPALAPLVQFGVAGLMAWMWTTERRSAAERERQLNESHDRLREQRVQLDALMKLIADNTRAVAALEASQRALVASLRIAGVTAGRRLTPAEQGEDPTERAA
ncbi:MAG: hypothetical protein J0L61_13720 [Planctomycetes bacterium]|nr:hypothetical protein [Planctomycetota bacterium]